MAESQVSTCILYWGEAGFVSRERLCRRDRPISVVKCMIKTDATFTNGDRRPWMANVARVKKSYSALKHNSAAD